MTTSIFEDVTDFTKFTSDIKLCKPGFLNNIFVHLSCKDDVSSYFDNNVEFKKAIKEYRIATNTLKELSIKFYESIYEFKKIVFK